jgi:hypothetical protein
LARVVWKHSERWQPSKERREVKSAISFIRNFLFVVIESVLLQFYLPSRTAGLVGRYICIFHSAASKAEHLGRDRRTKLRLCMICKLWSILFMHALMWDDCSTFWVLEDFGKCLH